MLGVRLRTCASQLGVPLRQTGTRAQRASDTASKRLTWNAMAKTWVLDTETKGTGAHIAPLKRDRDAAPSKLSLVNLHPPAGAGELQPDAAEASSAPPPKRFKVVDLLSGAVLAEDVSATDALAAMRSLRKAVDALVYVRNEEGRWRMLSLGDTKALWALRERAAS